MFKKCIDGKSLSRKYVEDRAILVALSGSRSYGLEVETSDFDYKGVFLQEVAEYLEIEVFEGKYKGWEKEPFSKFPMLTEDTVFHDFKKFLVLARKCNPGSLELLYSPKFIHCDEKGRYLTSKKDLFLTKDIKNRYLGYAKSEISKLERDFFKSGYVQYNLKTAMNIVRLLLQGSNAAKKGTLEIHVDSLPESESSFLKSIRRGDVIYEKLKDKIDSLLLEYESLDFDSLGEPLSDNDLSDIFLNTLFYGENDPDV